MDDSLRTGGSFRTALLALVFIFFTSLELIGKEDAGGVSALFLKVSKDVFSFHVLTMVKCLSLFEKL